MERDGVGGATPYGAGGKFRKRPFRKPTATPYDRPPLPPDAEASRSRGGWLSRLADPASRLLARGASRLLPSVFSKNPTDQQMKQDGSEAFAKDGSLVGVSENGDQDEHFEEASGFESDEPDGAKTSKSLDHGGGVDIEQLFKQKTFSREELHRLTEILRSRTIDLLDNVEQTKTSTDVPASGAAGEAFSPESLEKHEENQAANVDYETIGRIIIPPSRSTIYRDAGASPVDIAKAFMGDRKSSSLKDERMPPQSVGYKSALHVPSTPLKSPICWPGSMTQGAPGYLTPQLSRGRTSLYNLPRSPYHHTIHSRSISKGYGERTFNQPSSSSKRQQTPIFGACQVKKSMYMDDASTFAESNRSHKRIDVPMSNESLSSYYASPGRLSSRQDAFEGFISTVQENIDATASGKSIIQSRPSDNISGSSFSSNVHPHSSVVARKILEHLDRSVVSPKEKENELRLTVLGQKSHSEFSSGMLDGQHSRLDTRLASRSVRKEPFENVGSEKVSPPVTYDGEKSEFGFLNNIVSSESKTLRAMHEVSPGLADSENFEKLSSSHNQKSDNGFLKGFSTTACSDSHQKPQSRSSENKTAPTSISVTKPNGRYPFSSENGSVFTFPTTTTTTNVPVSEPPTPTMPSFAGNSMPQEPTVVPSFPFESLNVKKSPVFSFPSTVSSDIMDISIPKFNFGSEKGRLSFSGAIVTSSLHS